MRHNPASGAIVIILRSRHGPGRRRTDGTGLACFRGGATDPVPTFEGQTAEREVRSTAYQLKAARFPAYRDLSGLDFANSEVKEALVRQLHRCEFLEDAHFMLA